MENTKTEINQILFFDHTHKEQVGENDFEEVEEYSANLEVTLDLPELSDKKTFIIQVAGNENEAESASIPDSSQNLCGLDDQDWACENLDACEIWKLLEIEHDIENNFNFLQENGETLETI